MGRKKVPSLDLPATDSGTVAKSRDGSTAPSDVLDGSGMGQVGEHTGVLDNSGWQNTLPDCANLAAFGTAIRVLNYRVSLIVCGGAPPPSAHS